MLLTIPDPSLILMIGPSGSGKSTFAARHFSSTEIISSDYCRALIADDESNQSVTSDAFDLLRLMVRKRLKCKRLTVVDATNLKRNSRIRLLSLAFLADTPALAIAFKLSDEHYHHHNERRPNRKAPTPIVNEQISDLNQTLSGLKQEGLAAIYILTTLDAINAVEIRRQPIQPGSLELP